ncbi:MAG: hypothetical protein KY433_03625 [Actinobacteria bacterium]|nr:hypothetical protein [Actinomycetota bacterium]
MRDATYSYPDAEAPALRGIDLELVDEVRLDHREDLFSGHLRSPPSVRRLAAGVCAETITTPTP